jgi:hypothetical protein
MKKFHGRCQMICGIIYLTVTLGNQQNQYGTHKFTLAFKQESEQQVNTGITR